MVKRLLKNPVYLGHLIQLRTTTVSYKNHKVVKKDESEWAVIENNHEPIISQELWDRVREIDNSVSNGKSTKNGVVLPLSGLCYCAYFSFTNSSVQDRIPDIFYWNNVREHLLFRR